MKGKALLRLISGWAGTVRGALLAVALIPAVFVGMHWLGRGSVQELGYALLLVGMGALWMGTRSFLRYARVQMELWDALRHLPPDAADLPAATNALTGDFRRLSLAYQAAQREALERATLAEKERLDYFTLWVHQIKTPIAALDLMAQSSEPPPRSLMRQEVFKISQYADAALTFQRLQSMQNDLALADVTLYPLVSALVKKLRPIFLYRRIRLVMQPFEGVALSDAKWLGMAITQVLTNALKYTPEGGSITIRLEEPLLLTITDTGAGIRPEDLPRVFERGFTGSGGRNVRELEKSTGIGLYLCKQACDKLGHGLHIESPQEGGTRVVFRLGREGFEAFS